MIDGLTGTFVAAAAILLAVSGAAKLRRPGTAGNLVLRLLRRPARERRRAVALVRTIGAGELAVGAAVLGTGARPAAALLALAYLGFAGVAVVALRSDERRVPCGCFGGTDAPLGPGHLVLNLLACAAGLAALAQPPGHGARLLNGGLLDGGATTVVAVGQALLLAALAYLAVTSLPALLAARRALAPSLQSQES